MSLLEMAADIVAAHASTTTMTKEELVKELHEVYATLSALESGEAVAELETEEKVVSKADAKKSIGKNKITCLICGVSMKTLARHLKTKHDLKPGEYRKQFGIPRTQSLASKAYSETRRQMAIDRGLGDKLAAARKLRGTKPAAEKKAAAPKAKKAAAKK